VSDDPREPGWGMERQREEYAGREVDAELETLSLRSHGGQVERARETAQRVVQAARKGQVALLVTDATGVVIVGIKGTGGMTKLEYKASEGIWEAHVYLSGVTVLDGSYLLRAPLGWDEQEQDGPLFTCPRCDTPSWHPEDARNGYCGRCHDFTAQRRPLPRQRYEPDDGDVISDEQAEALAKRALERHQQPALPYPEGES
jgi:hypothetical protein